MYATTIGAHNHRSHRDDGYELPKGVRVLTLLPGFVDTPMTAGFAKGPLWATPERVAQDIDRALAGGFGRVYTPWFWRWIMFIVRTVPERLFVRTGL